MLCRTPTATHDFVSDPGRNIWFCVGSRPQHLILCRIPAATSDFVSDPSRNIWFCVGSRPDPTHFASDHQTILCGTPPLSNTNWKKHVYIVKKKSLAFHDIVPLNVHAAPNFFWFQRQVIYQNHPNYTKPTFKTRFTLVLARGPDPHKHLLQINHCWR